MDHYNSLKLLALRAVMKPDTEAQFRSICRWYSTTFHTPLHLVDDLPEDDILQAHYESAYEDMSEEDREKLLKELLETPQEKKERLLRKDIDEAESFDFNRQLAEEERQKQIKAKLAEVQIDKKESMLKPRVGKESQLPDTQPSFEKLEPDVQIKFVDAAEFEAELEGFGNMAPDKK